MSSITGHSSSSDQQGFVSINNAFNGLLSAGNTYTGVGEEVSNFSQTTIFIDADQNSAVLGLKMQVSTDNSDWSRSKDVTITGFSVHTLVVTAKYFRISYTNSTVDVNLKIQVIYHKSKSKHLTSTTNQVINDSNDIELMRVVNDPILDFARGIVSDKLVVHKFGHSTGVDTTESTVWNGGGNYTFVTTAETIRVKAGGDADDDVAGDGARTLIVEGLDANWCEISETITLAGTSASASTTLAFLRINRAFIESVGLVQASNTGAITIETTTTNDIMSVIEAERGQTQLGFYSVPEGHSAYLTRLETNLDSKTNKTADIFMYKYDHLQTNAPKRLVWRLDSVSGQNATLFKSFIKFSQMTDIEVRATATAISSLSVNFDLIVIDDLL